MPITRIVQDVPAEEVDFVVASIRANQGEVRTEIGQDGLTTVIGVFPEMDADISFPSAESQEFRWMSIARAEIGQKEVPGSGDNPRVVEYHASAGGASPDSVPWCASFVNFCITQAGLVGTNSKAARSWTNWGRDAGSLVPGCIVVLSRGADVTKGHVGFCVGERPGWISLLGGNQSDAVNIADFPASRLVAKRLPA